MKLVKSWNRSPLKVFVCHCHSVAANGGLHKGTQKWMVYHGNSISPLIYPGKMVIFHIALLVYQRVSMDDLRLPPNFRTPPNRYTAPQPASSNSDALRPRSSDSLRDTTWVAPVRWKRQKILGEDKYILGNQKGLIYVNNTYVFMAIKIIKCDRNGSLIGFMVVEFNQK